MKMIKIYIDIEVPGVQKAVNVKLDNGHLVIDVKADNEEAENEYRYYEKAVLT